MTTQEYESSLRLIALATPTDRVPYPEIEDILPFPRPQPFEFGGVSTLIGQVHLCGYFHGQELNMDSRGQYPDDRVSLGIIGSDVIIDVDQALRDTCLYEIGLIARNVKRDGFTRKARLHLPEHTLEGIFSYSTDKNATNDFDKFIAYPHFWTILESGIVVATLYTVPHQEVLSRLRFSFSLEKEDGT